MKIHYQLIKNNMREPNLKQEWGQKFVAELRDRYTLLSVKPEQAENHVSNTVDFFYNLHQEHIKAIRAELEQLRPETTMNESETCNPRCHASGSEDIIDQMLINHLLSLTEEE